MGFITLARFYNDHASEISEHSKEFCDELDRMLSGGRGGNIKNIAKIFRSRHDSDSSTYILNRGEADEMDPYSSETIKLIQQNPGRFASNLRFMRRQARMLEKMFKEYKDSNPPQE